MVLGSCTEISSPVSGMTSEGGGDISSDRPLKRKEKEQQQPPPHGGVVVRGVAAVWVVFRWRIPSCSDAPPFLQLSVCLPLVRVQQQQLRWLQARSLSVYRSATTTNQLPCADRKSPGALFRPRHTSTSILLLRLCRRIRLVGGASLPSNVELKFSVV